MDTGSNQRFNFSKTAAESRAASDLLDNPHGQNETLQEYVSHYKISYKQAMAKMQKIALIQFK